MSTQRSANLNNPEVCDHVAKHFPELNQQAQLLLSLMVSKWLRSSEIGRCATSHLEHIEAANVALAALRNKTLKMTVQRWNSRPANFALEYTDKGLAMVLEAINALPDPDGLTTNPLDALDPLMPIQTTWVGDPS